MKTPIAVATFAAAFVGAPQLALADHGHRDGRSERAERLERRDDRQEARRDLREARRDLREARRDLRHAREDRAHRAHLRRGGTLPAAYRAHPAVVHDWHRHHLAAPPRGHQWVQVNGDYALIAIASGLIASVLFSD